MNFLAIVVGALVLIVSFIPFWAGYQAGKRDKKFDREMRERMDESFDA